MGLYLKNKILKTTQFVYFERNYNFYFKDKIYEMDEHVEVQINYYKDEIEIRAESLKIEIDKIKDTLIAKLDRIKGDFK